MLIKIFSNEGKIDLIQDIQDANNPMHNITPLLHAHECNSELRFLYWYHNYPFSFSQSLSQIEFSEESGKYFEENRRKTE